MSTVLSQQALLVSKIRFASEPDNPALLNRWLDAPLPACIDTPDARRRYYLMQYQLLLSTLRDEFVPLGWRCICLEYIEVPLRRLCSLATTQTEKREVQRLRFEVAMLERCCLPKRTLH